MLGVVCRRDWESAAQLWRSGGLTAIPERRDRTEQIHDEEATHIGEKVMNAHWSATISDRITRSGVNCRREFGAETPGAH